MRRVHGGGRPPTRRSVCEVCGKTPGDVMGVYCPTCGRRKCVRCQCRYTGGTCDESCSPRQKLNASLAVVLSAYEAQSPDLEGYAWDQAFVRAPNGSFSVYLRVECESGAFFPIGLTPPPHTKLTTDSCRVLLVPLSDVQALVERHDVHRVTLFPRDHVHGLVGSGLHFANCHTPASRRSTFLSLPPEGSPYPGTRRISADRPRFSD